MKPVRPTNVESLIDRQMRMWEVRQKLAAEGGEAARRELVHLEQGPWVTVSRQIGSGGVEIAEAAAAALGWQLYDREIVAGIAEHTHLREQVLGRVDGRSSSWLSDYLNHLLTPESISQDTFAREMIEVVWAIAREGRAVLVGRGANWLLDPQYGLRVRVVAPTEVRVATVARHQDVSTEEAGRVVRQRDEQTRSFIRQTFDRDINDPAGYDLVINTAHLSVSSAAGVVQSALRGKLRPES